MLKQDIIFVDKFQKQMINDHKNKKQKDKISNLGVWSVGRSEFTLV